MEDEIRLLKAKLARDVVDHTAASDGAIATPGSEVARVRRDVLRGLRDEQE